MSEELELRPLGDIKDRKDLHILPRDEVERRAAKAEYWLEVAIQTRDVRDEIAQDLEDALNAMRSYQAVLVTLGMPDPNFQMVKRLCLKYGMSYTDPRGKVLGKVFADGKDITHDPDSIDSQIFTDDEIESVELVQLEDGSFHFIPGVGEDEDECD